MPRPKKAGDDGREVKKRSRNGCWPCKARKVKCGEEKPACATCVRQGEICDYSIRLNWDGRNKKKEGGIGSQTISFAPSPPSATPASPVKNTFNHQASSPHLSAATHHFNGSRQTSPFHSNTPQETILPPISQVAHNPPHISAQHNTLQVPSIPPILKTPSWTEPEPSHVLAPNLAPSSHPRQTVSFAAYPSPADSGFGSPGMLNSGLNFNSTSSHMLPPIVNSTQSIYNEHARSPYNPAKRMRLSPRSEGFTRIPRTSPYSPADLDGNGNPSTPTNFPPQMANPLTPAPSITSHTAEHSDDRRISVSSLLSEEPSNGRRSSNNTETSGSAEMPASRRGSLHARMISYSQTETYGYDRGIPDLDIPRNNDTQAISVSNTSDLTDFDSWLASTEYAVNEFGFRLDNRDSAFSKGGYYGSPVSIKIPSKLEPLPATLSENPMNLLYFHHFLNHTAKILVPHDCPENPFKTVLPKMAVENSNLLNLLLAYSACHRARLLGHPEPANRIALWVRDVFPHLRQTLQDTSDKEVSNANLATAIMLASLEIISPSSFGVDIPWQSHLSIARGIIRSRCGPHSISRKDPVMYFLTRWLAYLDVLGSLSGRREEEPLFSGNYWSSSHDSNGSAKELSLTDEEADDDDDYTIDCLLGFTTRCVSILAQVASLAHQCAEHRMDSETKTINEAWRPSEEVLRKAERLRRDLENARTHEQHQCHHHSPTMARAQLARRASYAAMTEKDAEESVVINSAYHLAGLIHLLRRVHNLPRSDYQVQTAVRELVDILSTVRSGGSAEACSLFPMFTAGVEAEDPIHRNKILQRLKSAEELGMYQMGRARKLMEEVWRTRKCWETLVHDDFFG